jgi:archaetidylinositol phosphate synthase
MPAKFDVRVNKSLLASQERRLLEAIASRLPKWCTPNGMTILGLVGGCVVILGYLMSRRDESWLWLANFGLLVHWAGDSLDGTLARHRDIERPRYGFYLDQVTDALGNVMIGLGVGLSPVARLDLALFVLASFHMLSIQVYVRAIVDREFHMAVGRLGPTEMRIGIFAMNIGIMAMGAPPIQGLPIDATWCDAAMLATGTGLFAMYFLQMQRHLSRLAKEDPRRPRDAAPVEQTPAE